MDYKFPTEKVELPSKGLVYPESNPLSSGYVEMKYMTAKEEDILTNQNYIQDGSVIDRLLKSLIVSKGVNYDDLIVGDRNAIMVAARVLGYGKDYVFTLLGEEHSVDLSQLENKYIDESTLVEKGVNKFIYELPTSKATIEYKLLTGKDDAKVKAHIKGIQKIDKKANPELSTRLKFSIISVNGDSAQSTISEFVDNYMLARDSKAFRDYLKATQPDVDMTFTLDINGVEEEATVPVTVDFFWPDN